LIDKALSYTLAKKMKMFAKTVWTKKKKMEDIYFIFSLGGIEATACAFV